MGVTKISSEKISEILKNKNRCFMVKNFTDNEKNQEYFDNEWFKNRPELLSLNSNNCLETVVEILLQNKGVLFLSSQFDYDETISKIYDICEDVDITYLGFTKYDEKSKYVDILNLPFKCEYVVVDMPYDKFNYLDEVDDLDDLEYGLFKYFKDKILIIHTTE